MLTNKITGFSADFLDAVKNILGEAKKCGDCGCGQCECEKEETKEGYMPTSDEPTDANKKTADKVRALLAKEKKSVKEESGMPFEKPYRKAGERKDEYGNKVKNVAKHLAKKAMKANEEADYLEKDLKKRKDNNDKAIKDMKKMGSPMRNPHFGEEVEQVDEISSDMAHRYLKGKHERDYDTSADGKSSKLKKPQTFAKMNKDMKSTARALRTIEKAKKTNEEVEQIDELKDKTLGSYINKAKDSIDTASYRQGHKEAHGSSSKALERKLTKRHKGIETAVKKLTREDAEQIDELKDKTLGSYIKKAATKIGTQGVTAGLKIAKDERSQKNFDTIGKRERGIALAVKKLTKEEQDFIDELNDADMAQIDEISKGTAMKALQHVSSDPDDVRGYTLQKKIGKKWPEMKGHAADASYTAGYGRSGRNIFQDRDKLADRAKTSYRMTKDNKANKQDLKARFRKEEAELEEARGRPRKAGAKDFTIHPKTKEKLMHDNPAHMKRIEALQKTGALKKPKTEANQHIIQQLQRAKLSMRGGETVNFTHGDSKQVTGTHAAKLLDKYAGMKPDEKEAFQKDIGHSHARLMKHV